MTRAEVRGVAQGTPAEQKTTAHAKAAPRVLLGLLVCYAVARSVVAAAATPLWYDEIITLTLSAQGGWKNIIGALMRACDSHPPLFYVIENVALKTTSLREVAQRLPSVIAFACSVICVFVCARRRAGESLALCCASFLLATDVFQFYATDARAYSLLVACVAFALVCYQRVRSWYWVAALGASLILAESLHHYAIFSVFPFALAEFVRSVVAKRVRWAVWLALLSPVAILAANWRFLAVLKAYYGPHNWIRYDAASLPGTYGELLSLGAVVGMITAGVCAAFVVRALGSSAMLSSFEDKSEERAEGALLIGFLLLPVITFAATKVLGATMLERYVLPTVLGIALAFGRIKAAPRGTGTLVFAFFGFCICIHEVVFWRSVPYSRPDKPVASVEAFVESAGYPALPVAVADGRFYFTLQTYATPEWKNRFVYLVDVQKALQNTGTDSIDKNVESLRPYLSFPVTDLSAFEGAHTKFLVYVEKPTTKFDWLSGYLESSGYLVKIVREEADKKLYLVVATRSARY